MVECQNLKIGGHEYHLVVGGGASVDEESLLAAVATKDGIRCERSLLVGRPGDTIEKLKRDIHRWAYEDAGLSDHACDPSCDSWRRESRNLR